jgi:hypothetical protein
VRKHQWSISNRSSREKLPKHAVSVTPVFSVSSTPSSVLRQCCPKTPHNDTHNYLIYRRGWTFRGKVVSQCSPLKLVFGRFLLKRPRRKIDGGIGTSLDKVSLNSEKNKHLHLSEPGNTQLPGEGKEENTAKAILTWVIHKQLPADLNFRNPPCSCVWITTRKNDRKRSKGDRVSCKEPLTQSCHFAISVKEEIG